MSRGHRRQFDGEHRNVKGRNIDVSIGDTALRYPAGVGELDRVPAPTACPEGDWALAAIGDSRCGSAVLPGMHKGGMEP